MNFGTNVSGSCGARLCEVIRIFVRLALGISAAVLLSSAAVAQTYPAGTAPNGTYTPPAGGYSSSTGIGIGVGAAAGAGALYLVMRHRGMVTGCVEQAKDGLALLDDKHSQTYSLMPGDTGVKPGEHVKIKGKKVKGDDGGAQMFEAKKLVKDLGTCNATSADASASSVQQTAAHN